MLETERQALMEPEVAAERRAALAADAARKDRLQSQLAGPS